MWSKRTKVFSTLQKLSLAEVPRLLTLLHSIGYIADSKYFVSLC